MVNPFKCAFGVTGPIKSVADVQFRMYINMKSYVFMTFLRRELSQSHCMSKIIHMN